jgi:hypothetical protein
VAVGQDLQLIWGGVCQLRVADRNRSVVGAFGRDSCSVQRILRLWSAPEAEAIYDSGRDACVQFMLDLAARVQQFEERLARLEAQSRQDSRTSSKPPSLDPPKTRAQRRAEARAKAKELMRREGEQRKAGGQSGHRGAGRELRPEDQVDEIVDHFPDAWLILPLQGICRVREGGASGSLTALPV